MEETKTVIEKPNAIDDIPLPDFEIKACIGEGAFGQVFLGLSKAIGRYRAIKVVRRSRFNSDHPYEVEFSGLKRFEEVSREHEGFVDILHASRNDQAGFFSYVMELADDIESAGLIDPARYIPRTLSKELERRVRLPPAECVRLALALTAALAELHRRNLVHRDVNPRNIIFVRGAPKLADVGLVTEASGMPHTLIGTPDYMDTEVHGTPAGDLYGFGKVLYTMATGLHPRQCPLLPLECAQSQETPLLRELEAIWRKACLPDRAGRYKTADEIHQELLALQAGALVMRLKRLELAMKFIRRYGLALLVLLLSTGAGMYLRIQQQRDAAELRQRKVGTFVANGNHSMEAGDLLGALSWFAQAWRLDSGKDNELIHRIRVASVLKRAPELEQIWFEDRSVKESYFAGQENQVIMSDPSGKWCVYDLFSLKALHEPFGIGLPGEKVSISSLAGIALTAAGTNTIWLWDYKTGAKLGEYHRPDTIFKVAALSPDGRFIAATAPLSSEADTILLWNTATDSNNTIVLGTHPVGAISLRFSPDSRHLLSCGMDSKARLWNLETAKPGSTFTNHLNWVYGGAFSPDGQNVVTVSHDRSARIWDAQTARELIRFNHDDAVFAAEFNADGTRLATAGLDFTARIWDPYSGKPLQVIHHHWKVLRAEFSPTGKFLLTSCYDGIAWAWRMPQFQPPHNGAPASEHSISPWSPIDPAGTVLEFMDLTDNPGVLFQFASDNRYFVVARPIDFEKTEEIQAHLFDKQNPASALRTLSIPRSWTNLAVSAGGQWLFACDQGGSAVWDTTSGQRAAGFGRDCLLASFSPDGKLLALGRSNLVEIFDPEENFARLARCTHPTNSLISSINWDTAGERLITACWNNSLTALEARTWTARSGAPAGPPLQHRDGVLFAAFNHSGSKAITCGEDLAAILWDHATGRPLTAPLRHAHRVFQASFSKDDRLVATSSEDNVISIWSVETGELLTSISSPFPLRNVKHSLRFTPSSAALLIKNDLSEFSWTLPVYGRQLEDLLPTCQLLCAQRTESIESFVPHSTEVLRKLWNKYRTEYRHYELQK
jgi:WD40 repeat protein/serine/threonine protein kinase